MSTWSNWKTEFDTAGAGFVSADALSLVLQGVGATAIFIWAAWICVSAFQEFGRGGVSATELGATWLRAVFLLAFLSYLFVQF